MMAQIGQPRSYTDNPTPPHLDVPTKKFPKPKTEEEFYETLKHLFLEKCKVEPGPWRLTRPGLKMLCVQNKLKSTDDEISAIWKRMVKELCHEDLILPTGYNFVAKLREVDDCMEVIYAIADSIFLGDKVQILYLSSTTVAVLLRLAGE